MKHISEPRLGQLEPLLVALRKVDGLTEKKRGVFYRKSHAFLHFHEDPAGLFADVRLDAAEFARFDVPKRRGQNRLVSRVRAALP
ncbi:MAG: hypothetical protein P8R42_28145 [Candidatus Binatia bacterium]|nr:hypothetical protein [Candidatus Binatia bacterium]